MKYLVICAVCGLGFRSLSFCAHHERKYHEDQKDHQPKVDIAKIRAETETLKKYSETKDPAKG